MKFCYTFGVILIGVVSLIVTVINHWQKLPDRFGKEINQDTPTQVFSAPVVRGYNEDDKATHTGPASEVPVEQIPEAKALTDFVNSQFKQAAKLYGERLEIRKRRKPNGRYSPRDQKRLQEIHLAVYSHLKAIDEKIEGATQPYLSRQTGTIRCGYYLMPHKLKERLGIVPAGYYLFEKSILMVTK